MKLTKILVSAVALTAMAGAAQAQDAGPYVNVGVEGLDFFGVSGNAIGRIGTTFTDYFGVEGELRVGVLEDNDEFKIDFGAAGYGIAKFPVSEQFDIFGRVGYHYTEAGDADVDGIAFGGGVQFNFGPDAKNGIRLDYTNLDGDGGSADTYAITYARKF